MGGDASEREEFAALVYQQLRPLASAELLRYIDGELELGEHGLALMAFLFGVVDEGIPVPPALRTLIAEKVAEQRIFKPRVAASLASVLPRMTIAPTD